MNEAQLRQEIKESEDRMDKLLHEDDEPMSKYDAFFIAVPLCLGVIGVCALGVIWHTGG